MAGVTAWLLESRELGKVSNCSLVKTVAQASSLVRATLFWAPSQTPWAVTTGCAGGMLDAESAGFCGAASAFWPAGEACADGFEDCAFEAWLAVGVCANTAPAVRISTIPVRVMELHLPANCGE